MLLRSLWGKTLRDERGGIIGYGIGLALYGLLIVTMFPSVKQMPNLQELLDSYPQALKAMIGEVTAMTTIEGFVAIEVLTWVPLILAIFVIMSATDFVAGEGERGILDVVLSQPVARWRIIVERMVALTVSLVAIALLTGLAVWAGLPFANVQMSLEKVIGATLATVPLVLVIAGCSLLLGCLLMSRKKAGMIAAALTVTFYLVNSLADVVEALKPWQDLSPFHYFQAYNTLLKGPDLTNSLILVGVTILLVLASIVVFQRRDIVTN